MKSYSLFSWVLAFVLAAQIGFAAQNVSNAATYDEHLMEANALFKKEDLNGALLQVQAAAKLDPKRYEAPATAALILHRAKRPAEARAALEEALQLVPADKKEKVQAIAKVIGDPAAKPDPAGTTTPPATEPAKLTGAARRQLDTLMVIIEEADKAKTEDERKKVLREFMAKSADFVVENPTHLGVWVLRAIAALEVDYPGEGWLAGRRLKELGADESDDPKVRKVMAQLDRKEWLGKERKWRDWSKWTTEKARQSANEGDAESQFAMGDWYSRGESGLPKDALEAAKCYRKAAEAGDADARYKLAVCYDYGQGVQEDEVEATKWYRKAAEVGHRASLEVMPSRYARIGGKSDEMEVTRWYRKSAEAGNRDGQIFLARRLLRGIGVVKDESEALRWYRKAIATEIANGIDNISSRLTESELALRLAASPDPTIRNGAEALQIAQKVCNATKGTNGWHLGLLATAYAETGNFDEAVKYAQLALKAADLVKYPKSFSQYEARLKLYENHMPYRIKD